MPVELLGAHDKRHRIFHFLDQLTIESVERCDWGQRNKNVDPLIKKSGLACLSSEHLRCALRVSDVGDLLHLGLATDKVNEGGLVVVAELVESEIPELRQGHIQEPVIGGVLVPATVAEPDVEAVVDQKEGKRALLVHEHAIARVEQAVLVKHNRPLFLFGPTFGVLSGVGAPGTVNVVAGVVVAVGRFVLEPLEGVLVKLANLEQTSKFVDFLDILLVLGARGLQEFRDSRKATWLFIGRR